MGKVKSRQAFWRVIVASLSVVLALVSAAVFASQAFADDSDEPQAEIGFWGTAEYRFDFPTKCMTVYPGEDGATLEGRMPYAWDNDGIATVKSVKFVAKGGQKVIAPSDCWRMFDNYSDDIVSIDARGLDTSHLTSLCEMFDGCSALTSVNVSGWNTSHVTNMIGVFNGCSSLTSLDLSSWDTSHVTDMNSLVGECESLASINLSGWDTSSVTDMNCMFLGCSSLTSVDVSNWDTSHVTYLGPCMFQGCSSLTSIDVSKWDTSNATDISCIFSGCSSLTSVDVSGWDTSNATEMDGIFWGCESLTSVDVSNWNTSSATKMSTMFLGCSSLTAIDVSKWDTSHVTDMGYMFDGCSSLVTLDVSKWDTSMVGYVEDDGRYHGSGWPVEVSNGMDSMFRRCSSLATLDVSGWNTANTNYMNSMFEGCSALTSLDLSSWDTSKVTDMRAMFEGCVLDSLTLGATYVAVSEEGIPQSTAANGKWWSDKASRWFTRAELATRGVADTYTVNGSPEPEVAFSDVTDSTSHADDITWLASAGISTGWTVGSSVEFRPNANVKRGDMAAFLFRLAKQWGVLGASDNWKPKKATRAKFTDVGDKTSHAQAIWWMAENGISAGWDVGGGKAEFRPNADVKRGDLAAFLGRLADKAGRKGSAKPDTKAFLDVTAKTSHCDEIWWMAASGVSGGWDVPGGKEFRPNKEVKRGDMAAFLHRLDGVA